MIISAKVIQKPRERRRCEDCLDFIDGPQLKLYGYAETGDHPYTIYLHPYHPNRIETDPKIIAALNHSSKKEAPTGAQ